MRRLDHQNIVQLKYFFFSSGDKVIDLFVSFSFYFYLEIFAVERRSLSKSCPRICSGNGLSCSTTLYQTKANHSYTLCQSNSFQRTFLLTKFSISSCTCINYFVHWLIYIHLGFVIETLNRKIFCLIRRHPY